MIDHEAPGEACSAIAAISMADGDHACSRAPGHHDEGAETQEHECSCGERWIAW